MTDIHEQQGFEAFCNDLEKSQSFRRYSDDGSVQLET